MILCTGAVPAVDQAFASVDRGGSILFYAPTMPDVRYPIDIADLWKNGITLVTTYAADFSDLKEAMRLISGKRVKVSDMITDRLSLDDAGKGFRSFADGKSIKVVIRPHGLKPA